LAERLALLVWSATPERPDLIVTPLVHALAARALDAEVEIHFAGPAVRWLVAGVADAACPADGGERSVGDYLRDAANEGVRLLACSMALAAWRHEDEPLIADCAGAAGATAFVVRALDPAWATLVF